MKFIQLQWMKQYCVPRREMWDRWETRPHTVWQAGARWPTRVESEWNSCRATQSEHGAQTHTYTYIHTYIHTYISQQHTSRPRQHSLWRGVQTLWAAWAAPPTTFVWGARLATSATTQQSPSQRCSFELQCTNVVIVIAFLSHALQRLTFGAVFADFDKMLDHFGTRCHRLSFNNFCWYLKYTARASAFMVKQSKNHKKIALFSLIYPLCNSVEPFCKCNNICCFIWSFSPRLIWKKTKKKFASRRKEPSKIDTCLINSRPRIEVNKACSNKVNWLAIAKKKATKQ